MSAQFFTPHFATGGAPEKHVGMAKLMLIYMTLQVTCQMPKTYLGVPMPTGR